MVISASFTLVFPEVIFVRRFVYWSTLAVVFAFVVGLSDAFFVIEAYVIE